MKNYPAQGRIQDCLLVGGGGGRKILCARTHITIAKSLTAGVQLWGGGVSSLVLSESYFLSILIQNGDLKNYTVDQF